MVTARVAAPRCHFGSAGLSLWQRRAATLTALRPSRAAALWRPAPLAAALHPVTYARRHGLVPASLFGVWLPQLKMVSRHCGPPLSTLGRRRRCQREPGCLRDDAASPTAGLGAHGLEQPRMLPEGNQSQGAR